MSDPYFDDDLPIVARRPISWRRGCGLFALALFLCVLVYVLVPPSYPQLPSTWQPAPLELAAEWVGVAVDRPVVSRRDDQSWIALDDGYAWVEQATPGHANGWRLARLDAGGEVLTSAAVDGRFLAATLQGDGLWVLFLTPRGVELVPLHPETLAPLGEPLAITPPSGDGTTGRVGGGRLLPWGEDALLIALGRVPQANHFATTLQRLDLSSHVVSTLGEATFDLNDWMELRLETGQGSTRAIGYNASQPVGGFDLTTGADLASLGRARGSPFIARLTPLPANHVDKSITRSTTHPPLAINFDSSMPAAYANPSGGWRNYLPAGPLMLRTLVLMQVYGPQTAFRSASQIEQIQGVGLADGSGLAPRLLQGDMLDVARSQVGVYPGLYCFELSPTEALICQTVHFPPASVNAGQPLLRLGRFTQGANQIDWFAWCPLPGEHDEGLITLVKVERAEIVGSKLRLLCHVHGGTYGLQIAWITLELPAGTLPATEGRLLGN